LNDIARQALNLAFDEDVWVVGEIHGLKMHSQSSHLYFDLVEKPSHGKEQYIAKVSCAFFKGAYTRWQGILAKQGIPFLDLTDGLEVKVKAKVDLYAKEGRFQIIIQEIDPSYSLGFIAKKRMQTIETLKGLGVMDKNKKLPLPYPAVRIGLITSKGSAAYNDFMSILKKSEYAFDVKLYNAYMQGEATIAEIIKGIKKLESMPGLDAIVITRGGGAKTDLIYFDDIELCKAIAKSKLPVITGIGHEIDVSVADLVAFAHMVTPTDVARFLVDRVAEFLDQVEELGSELIDVSREMIYAQKARQEEIARSIAYIAQRWVFGEIDRVKTLARTAESSVSSAIASHANRITRMQEGIVLVARYQIIGQKQQIRQLFAYIKQGFKTNLSQGKVLVEKISSLLDSMDPKVVLARGYSITLDKKGKSIKKTEDIALGDRITTLLYKGKIKSLVEEKES
jgi:exodeoxyribonuclease VII large subunit